MSKYNPFRPNSVVTPGMFRGRYDEIRRIEQALVQTRNGNPHHFLIEGERGIGKSSLFLLIDYEARGQIELDDKTKLKMLVASVELRETMDFNDIVNEIIGELRREMSSREQIKELCKKAWGFLSKFEAYGIRYNEGQKEIRENRLQELTELLVDIIEGAGDSVDGVLILIDEADKPDASANLGELCKLLTERLTRRRCEKVSIGVAGLPGLITKLRDSHASAPRVFEVFSLEPLEVSERKDVIDSGLSEAAEKNSFRTEITDEAKEAIAQLSEGYPHFLQEFAYCAFDKDRDGHIDRQDVLDGAFGENGAFHQLGKKYFSELYITQIGSDDYRKVLSSMAESLDEWVSRPEIIKRSRIKPKTVDNALHSLKNKKIILSNERIKGQYRLPTKSFAAWIRALESAQASSGQDAVFPGLGLTPVPIESSPKSKKEAREA